MTPDHLKLMRNDLADMDYFELEELSDDMDEYDFGTNDLVEFLNGDDKNGFFQKSLWRILN